MHEQDIQRFGILGFKALEVQKPGLKGLGFGGSGSRFRAKSLEAPTKGNKGFLRKYLQPSQSSM